MPACNSCLMRHACGLACHVQTSSPLMCIELVIHTALRCCDLPMLWCLMLHQSSPISHLLTCASLGASPRCCPLPYQLLMLLKYGHQIGAACMQPCRQPPGRQPLPLSHCLPLPRSPSLPSIPITRTGWLAAAFGSCMCLHFCGHSRPPCWIAPDWSSLYVAPYSLKFPPLPSTTPAPPLPSTPLTRTAGWQLLAPCIWQLMCLHLKTPLSPLSPC